MAKLGVGDSHESDGCSAGSASARVFRGRWRQVDSGTTEDLRGVAVLDEMTAVAVGLNGTILRSTDGGEMWVAPDLGSASSVSIQNSPLILVNAIAPSPSASESPSRRNRSAASAAFPS